MTRMATTSRSARPCWLDWNAWAVPANAVVMSDESVLRAAAWTWATASLRPAPSRVSNDSVTAGTWPEWFTLSGPTAVEKRATVDSGTSSPRLERTERRRSAEGSRWYSGSTSRITQYWLLGV